MISQRINTKTPNGGDYVIAYYQNDAGESVDKDKATRAEFVEYATGGEIVHRTYMVIE